MTTVLGRGLRTKPKRRKLPPAEIVTLRIPRAMLRDLDRIARVQRITRTAIILHALHVRLDRPS